MPLKIGEVLEGRYRIEALQGEGGMGTVYRATDLQSGALVAVKANLQPTTEAQRQFRREAELLHHTQHPNLPRVRDYLRGDEGRQYLVMDFIEGQNLLQRLRAGGPLPEGEALLWIGQVLDALDYLHSLSPRPIIHRDVKPANIKISPERRVYLVDFGLAKEYHDEQRTATGARGMTPGYASPEQVSGGKTDARSDVYAVGATLYALLTGQVPPRAGLIAARTAELVAPRQLNPAISNHVEAAILRAMRTAAPERFQTAAAFREALGEEATRLSSEAGPEEVLASKAPPTVPKVRVPEPVAEPAGDSAVPQRQPALDHDPPPTPEQEYVVVLPPGVDPPGRQPATLPPPMSYVQPPSHPRPLAYAQRLQYSDLPWFPLLGLMGLAQGVALALLLVLLGFPVLPAATASLQEGAILLAFLAAFWFVAAVSGRTDLSFLPAVYFVLAGALVQVAAAVALILSDAAGLPLLLVSGLALSTAGGTALRAHMEPASRGWAGIVLAVVVLIGSLGTLAIASQTRTIAWFWPAMAGLAGAMALTAGVLRWILGPRPRYGVLGTDYVVHLLLSPALSLLGIAVLAGLTTGTWRLALPAPDGLLVVGLAAAGAVAGSVLSRWLAERSVGWEYVLVAGVVLLSVGTGMLATTMAGSTALLSARVGAVLAGLGLGASLAALRSKLGVQDDAPAWLVWTAFGLGIAASYWVIPQLRSLGIRSDQAFVILASANLLSLLLARPLFQRPPRRHRR